MTCLGPDKLVVVIAAIKAEYHNFICTKIHDTFESTLANNYNFLKAKGTCLKFKRFYFNKVTGKFQTFLTLNSFRHMVFADRNNIIIK